MKKLFLAVVLALAVIGGVAVAVSSLTGSPARADCGTSGCN